MGSRGVSECLVLKVVLKAKQRETTARMGSSYFDRQLKWNRSPHATLLEFASPGWPLSSLGA